MVWHLGNTSRVDGCCHIVPGSCLLLLYKPSWKQIPLGSYQPSYHHWMVCFWAISMKTSLCRDLLSSNTFGHMGHQAPKTNLLGLLPELETALTMCKHSNHRFKILGIINIIKSHCNCMYKYHWILYFS